jgi:two-component system, NarL family, response regulator DevR
MVDNEPIRVFLMDDHELVREGVRHVLEASGQIVVVGEAGTCADALIRVPATMPHVAILDVQLPDGSGVEVCRELRNANPELVCLMLTSFSDSEAMFQAVIAGAAGFVLKQVRGNDLANTVKRVAAGESLIDPIMTGRLLDRLRNPQDEGDPKMKSLTPLERSILNHVAEGMTNRQIASQLNIAEKTVKNYMSSILLKLGFTRRTEAAVYAVKSRPQVSGQHSSLM